MFDDTKGITKLMRTKEQAQDYRFISDPDLPIIKIKNKKVEELKSQLPETPLIKLNKLIKKYKIPERNAKILTKKLEIVEFFEKIIEKSNPKLAVRWVTEELLSVLNYNKKELEDIEIKPEHFIELLKLIENKKITELKAKEILRGWKEKSLSPKAKGHEQISNSKEIEKIVKKVIKENLKAVEDFKKGEQKSMNFLIGQVMRLSDKRADYKTARDILGKLI
jgi:aspartyl-tRNA(Asn)/glutamyl-tRNA(Gln) amidotransferase subunit B